MKEQKKIGVNRKDIVIAYTLLRITVGLVLVVNIHSITEALGLDSSEKRLAYLFSGNLDAIALTFKSTLIFWLIIGNFNRLTIIILLLFNALVIANNFYYLYDSFEIAKEAPNINASLKALGYYALVVVQSCLYHCLLLILLICNSFNDISFDTWTYSNKKSHSKRSNRRSNKANE